MKTITRKYISNALVLVGLFIALINPAYSDTIIGRWCDKMIPNMPQYNYVMAISVDGKGKAILNSRYADGSINTYVLRELPGGIYEKIDSTNGDKYRIKANDGDLQLIDNDGIIRVAKRLKNNPKKGDCHF